MSVLKIRLGLLLLGVVIKTQTEAQQLTAYGPLEFHMATSDTDQVMNKKSDTCVVATRSSNAEFKVGSSTYSQITVCENGYIIPGIAGTPETATALTSPEQFLNPNSVIIAIGLIDNSRLDNMFDYECNINSEKNNYVRETICSSYRVAHQSYWVDGFTTGLDALYAYFLPSYTSNATNAHIITTWKGTASYSVSYLGFVQNDIYDSVLRTSIFSRSNDQGKFVNSFVNNIFIAELTKNSDFLVIAGLTKDSDFTVSWAICISWYKVAKPPEIIDEQNTFQLVLACMQDVKCILVFDYFELMYVLQNGHYMRAGVNIPAQPFIGVELPGSGTVDVSDLITNDNTGSPGLWLFELDQSGCAALMLNYTPIADGSPCPSTQLPTTPPATTAAPTTPPATTAAPTTPPPTTAAPTTPPPTTAAPTTQPPTTAAPTTPPLTTAAPTTPPPTTSAPTTPPPTTAAPTTPPPTTAAPTTPPPTTSAPTISIGGEGRATASFGGGTTAASGGGATDSAGGGTTAASGGGVTDGAGGGTTAASGGGATDSAGGGTTAASGGGVSDGAGGGTQVAVGDGTTAASGGGVTVGSRGGTTAASGGGVTVGSRGGTTAASGGGVTVGSRGGTTAASGGGVTVGSRGGTTAASGGGVTVGSRGGTTAASGGGVTVGSRGGTTAASGGGVTVGSRGGTTAASGGGVTVGSRGVTTAPSGGGVTVGSRGGTTAASGGGVTFGIGSGVSSGITVTAGIDQSSVSAIPFVVYQANITLLESTSTTANLSVIVSDGSATIQDIIASCQSPDSDACNSFAYEANNVSSINGWIQVRDLKPGTSYTITVTGSTLNGVSATPLKNSVIFCTVPLVGNSSFNGELLNSTSISIDLTSNAENFDNGTVTVTDTNGTVLEEKSFARADFPFQIHDLPNITTLDNIQIRFQFSVGTVVDCGNGVIVSSVEEFFTLDPKDLIQPSYDDEAGGPLALSIFLVFSLQLLTLVLISQLY
ncbi:uncharacterized protein LOC142342851 isoform X2 [Convolutriloba macropyga]|uniref:uncharacterized protein LOC142342851 isoform X2 n=1 Tax=Convolutriloba macropyga TaxID=536237 RepID=UPI003F51B022